MSERIPLSSVVADVYACGAKYGKLPFGIVSTHFRASDRCARTHVCNHTNYTQPLGSPSQQHRSNKDRVATIGDHQRIRSACSAWHPALRAMVPFSSASRRALSRPTVGLSFAGLGQTSSRGTCPPSTSMSSSLLCLPFEKRGTFDSWKI
jgi:hypothetical protein